MDQQFLLKATTSVDNDLDGIEDLYDQFDGLQGQEETLQTVYSLNNRYRIQSDTGTQVKLGSLATLADNKIAQVTGTQLYEYVTNQSLTSKGQLIFPENAREFLNLFDFEITNLPTAGASVTSVIPLNHPASDNSALLLFNAKSRQWTFFDTDNQNRIKSTVGSAGTCPDIDDTDYAAGILANSYCLHLTIADGGANDLDGERNGRVSVMAGIGTRTNLSQSSGSVNVNDAMASMTLAKSLFNYQVNQLDSTPGKEELKEDRQRSGGGAIHFFWLLSLLYFYRRIVFASGSRVTRHQRRLEHVC